MQQNLEAQANLIEHVLTTHKIHSRVWGGSVTPRFIRYDLTTTAGIRVQKVLALKDEIALMLGVSDVRMYRKDGAIRVEVPRSSPSIVRLLPLVRSLPKLPSMSAVLGVDEEGVPLLLRLPSPDVAHMLVAGTTGFWQDRDVAIDRTQFGHAQSSAQPAICVDRSEETGLRPLDGIAAPGSTRCCRDR